MAPKTLQERMLHILEQTPKKKAIAFADRNGKFTWLTVEEFHQMAASKAIMLRECGLQKRDRVVLVAGDPCYGASTIDAILQIGAVPLLVAPPAIQGVNSNLENVTRHVVGLTRATVVLLPKDMKKTKDELQSACPDATFVFESDDPKPEFSKEIPFALPDPSSIASLQLTSGTTGFPKVCVWGHEQILSAVDGMASGMHLAPDDIYVNWTPLYHDMGLVNNFLLCMLTGTPLVLINPLDFVRKPSLWLQVLHNSKGTVTWSPNFGYALAAQRIHNDEIEGISLEHVKGFWNAGEKVHYSTFKEFYKRFNGYGVQWESLKANFGCAENIGGATFGKPNTPPVAERVQSSVLHNNRQAILSANSNDEDSEWIVGTGKAHSGLKIHILDDNHTSLSDGSVGEIALETSSALVEFMGQPDETAKIKVGKYLLTGDLGYLRNGELFWIGREQERINLSGVKHDPSDFERVVNRIEGLRKGCFAAFGVEDKEVGTERLVLLCEITNDTISKYTQICNEVRRQTAVKLGVTTSVIALVPKGTLTKTSSGKRRHLYFKDMYLKDELEIIHHVGGLNKSKA